MIYTIVTCTGSQQKQKEMECFALHNIDALMTYKDDEEDLRKTSNGQGHIIANHAVRRRLLAATAPPGDVDLASVATLVKDSVGDQTTDIATRSWYCLVSGLSNFLPMTYLINSICCSERNIFWTLFLSSRWLTLGVMC